MTVKELKDALAKYGGDFDNFHVIFHNAFPYEQPSYELICGVAYAKDLTEIEAIFLCGEGAVKAELEKQKEEGIL